MGVPQGSILGAWLFLLYVNSLPQISNQFSTISYADDTTISTSGQNLENLTLKTNSELDKLSQWTISNKLTLNAEKTEFLIFSNRLTSNDSPPVLQLQGVNHIPFKQLQVFGCIFGRQVKL